MLTLLIVDDESVIREGLCKSFNWSAWGYTVCGTASNGIEALRLADQLHPDVILTDIEMPDMSGTALLSALKKQRFSGKTVVLSGYDRFEYAKEALRCGAKDYLLKPIDESELYTLFSNLRETILSEQRQASELQRARLIAGAVGDRPEARALQLYFSTGNPPLAELELITGKLSPYLCLASLESLLPCQSLADALSAAGVTVLSEGEQTLLFLSRPQPDAPAFLQQLLSSLSGEFRCVVSEYAADLPALRARYPSFLARRAGDFYYDFGGVYAEQAPVSPCDPESAGELDEAGERLFLLIRAKKESEAGILCHRLFHTLRKLRPSRGIVTVKCCEIYNKTASLLSNRYSRLTFRSSEEVYQRLSEQRSLRLFESAFCALISELIDAVKSFSNNRSALIDSIRQFIVSHYAEKLSLDQLSGEFYLNPSYLSALFKEETGETLSCFIRQVRLEQAKALLTQRNLRLSIEAISKAVGYQNYRHFCAVFKEDTGQSPAQFRIHSVKREG